MSIRGSDASKEVIYKDARLKDRKPDRDVEWRRLMDKKKRRINIGEEAFPRWRTLMSQRRFSTDAEMALFLLDWCAASPQNHDPDNETSRGHPPLMKNDSPELIAPHNVCVNMACLLQLFRQCGQCSGECVVRKQGDKRHFTVIQHCQICNLLTTWTSQPLKEDVESVHRCEVTEWNRVFTASLMMREWLDDRKTDTAREESLLTDEDIKVIRPAEVAETEESVVLPCEVREGDQESTASMMTTMGSQTDGGPSRKTSQLTEDEKKEKDQKSDNKLDPFAEMEMTVDSNFSDESQRSQEDSDGGGEEEGEEAEEKGEGGVENKHIEKEAEEVEGTETAEEEDEWEIDDDDESEWDEDEDYDNDDDVRKVRKRARVDGPDPHHQEEDEREMDDDDEESKGEMDGVRIVWKRIWPNGHNRREYIMKQNRTETLCPDCGLLYKTLSHKCDPKNKFQCPDCGVFFLTELSLGVHRNNHRRNGSHYHPCTFCLETFKTRQDKLAHEISHTGEKPYECPECPLRFSDRATRSRHLKEHPTTLRCQTCQKEFPNHYKLQRHEISHSTNKPFKCQVCDRVFAQASQLKSHLRVHTGEKPFHCQLCPKCFNHNISLKNHIRRYHQGESHDNPGPALREQEEGYHGPEPEADDGAEQERVEGREMKHSRSQKQEDVAFWTELNIAQRGNIGGMQGCQWLPAYSEEHQEDSQGMLNNQDSDFDPEEEERITSTRKGRGMSRGRGRSRGRHQ